MTLVTRSLLLASLLAPSLALATEPSNSTDGDAVARDEADTDAGTQAAPPPPNERVPPPPVPGPQAPPAPERAQVTPPASPPPAGQWVYTGQYGWVWMPYDPAYTRAPPDAEPYMFVYGPAFGWTWVSAPWVWGWGPSPWFGAWGGIRFVWWGHGWGPRWHGWRPAPFRYGYPFHGPYRGMPLRGGPAWHAPGPYRPGPGWRGPGPMRAGPGFRGHAFRR